MYKGVLLVLCTAPLLAACGEASAPTAALTDDTVLTATEPFRDVGEFTIYVNAMPTAQLTAEVASRYGIVRSQNRAMLTVNVLRNGAAGTAAAHATITASATNLSGQLRKLTLREVAEADAIYYIGETAITNAETLIFTIQVTPEGSAQTHAIRYMKQFFVD
jgi:hypothetical protein